MTVRRSASIAAAVALVMAAGACSGGSSGATGSGSSSATMGGTSPTPIATTPLPSPSVTVPATTRTTLPAAPVDRPAEFGTGVTVDVAGTRAVTVTGRGPGQLSGPAVAVSLKLTNGTDRSIDVTNSVIAAFYGDDVPANESTSSPAKPWRGMVKPESSITGTYVFLIPVKQRTKVHLAISYDPTKPVVTLVGDLS